jgi:hypothetical protein
MSMGPGTVHYVPDCRINVLNDIYIIPEWR